MAKAPRKAPIVRVETLPSATPVPTFDAASPTPVASQIIHNRGSRGPDFGASLAEIAELDIGELRLRYRKLQRKTPPAHLPRWLLARIVAYQTQARMLGDLDAETVTLLAGLARAHERDLKARTKASFPFANE